MLAIAAGEVVPVLKRAENLGIRAAIVYAAGFAEAGESGAQVQAELEAFIARTSMVVAGPNCMGFANLNSHAYTAFAQVFRNVPPQREPGRVSLVTQSGNVCAAVFALIRELGVPVSHFINTGNEAGLEFSQYLEFLAQDVHTDCVVGYIEQLRDGQGFIDAALACAEAGKPLVMYKAGETEKGSEAVRSHTSALAGNLALYQSAFEQLNVIAGSEFSQMADLAMLSAYRQRSAGLRVAIVTVSGALGAILADKFIEAGLEVPTFTPELQAQLRAGIPEYGMVSNPVDCTGNVVNDTSFVSRVANSLAESPDVDVVVFYAMSGLLDRMAEPLIEVCKAKGKLFVAIDTGAAKNRQLLADNGIPVFTDIGRAVRALAPFCLWHHRREQVARWAQLRREAGAANETPDGPRLANQIPNELPNEPLNEYETKRLLSHYGVATLSEAPAHTAEEAAAVAAQVGFPVVLKILSADIAHKTEIGGVRLNLEDEASVRRAFDEVVASARRDAPDARIDGVLVSPMAKGVAEVIVGITPDTPGVEWHSTQTSDGSRASDVSFTQVSLAEADRVISQAPVEEVLQKVLDEALVALCWEMTGVMQAALSQTVDYTRERTQFGQALAKFQVVQHRLAEMAVACEEARSACELAALRMDAPGCSSHTAQAMASLAKSKVGRAARTVAYDAVQLHGGMGVCEELPVAAMFRKLMAFTQRSGSTAVHSERYGQLLLKSGQWQHSVTLEEVRVQA